MKKTQIEQAVQDFLDYLATLNRTPATLQTYRRTLGYFTKFAEEKFLAETTDQLNESLVEAWMKSLHERWVKASTRRTWLTVMKSWSKYLAHREHTKKDIAYPIAMPKAERRKPVWVADEKIRETLNYLLSNGNPRTDFWLNLRDHLLIRLLYVTGMRVGEVMGLDPSKDIRWESGSIEVLGKGRKQRTVYADATTMELLKLFLEEQQKRMPNG
ncbi:MAG: tyrosine-type recombinase/integrase, partial [Halobacteria archaeon]